MARAKKVRRTAAKKRRLAPKRARSRRGMISVREAADLIGMTTSGVYGAIKRGDIPVDRTVTPMAVQRSDARAYRQSVIDWLKRTDPNRRLTEAEFIQALWDSDPD